MPSPRLRSRRLRISIAFLTAGTALLAPLALPTASPARAASDARDARVRLNQLGYPTGVGFRVYLMSTGSEAGATWTLQRGATTAGSGSVGANLGSWSSTYPNIYAITVPAQATAGDYSLTVSGPIPTTSPTFPIDTGQHLYAGALANALSFYQVQRDGPNFIPSALRTAGGHLHDANAMTYTIPNYNKGSGTFKGDLHATGTRVDAAGGWFDAGDYLKFTMATSYAESLMLTGVRDFPAQMGASAGRSDFTAEGKFGAHWLLRMWDDATSTMYFQVGIGEGNAQTLGDHDIWRLPQADDHYGATSSQARYIRHRPVFRAGPPGSLISPNIAGRVSAALAEAYQVYKTSDPAFADRCLLAAQHIFDLADTNPGKLTTAIPYSFYPESEWRDDLELGATELYYATAMGDLPAGLPHTDASYYLGQAATWAHAYITGPNDAQDTLNLYDVSGLAHYELYRAITLAGNPGGLALTKAQLLADMKKALDGAIAQSGTDPFGFGFTWAAWDTTTHGAGLSVMASEYDQLSGTSMYANDADRWLANILGANAWGLSLIVGDGSRFPHCLQHQVANLAGSLSGRGDVLAGAAVEGPNSRPTHGRVSKMLPCPANGRDRYSAFNGQGAQFLDNVESYDNTEPAVDLTASSPLAFARQAAGLR